MNSPSGAGQVEGSGCPSSPWLDAYVDATEDEAIVAVVLSISSLRRSIGTRRCPAPGGESIRSMSTGGERRIWPTPF